MDVVMPSYNSFRTLRKVLESLLARVSDAEIRIFVVDNQSTDGSLKIAKQFPVEVIVSDAKRVGGVRNAGIKRGDGDIIVNLDADCLIGPDYFRAVREALSDERVGAVGGVCLNPENATWVEQGWLLYEPPGLEGPANMLWGSSLALRRSVYEEVGGFDDRIEAGEDSLLSWRIRQAGYELRYLPECSVIHLGNPKTLAQVFRKEVWHASSYLQSRTGGFDKTFVATLLFLLGFLTATGALLFYPYAALAGLGLMAAVVAAFTAHRFRKSNRKKISPALIAKAWVVDWAYFAGRSVGLLKSLIKSFKGEV